MKWMKPNSLRHHGWTFSALVLLSLAACAAKERHDLILVDVDLSEVPTTQTMDMAVLSSATSALLLQQTVATPSTLANGVAKIGLTQPAGLSGAIFVQVTARDANGLVLGQGANAQPVPVTSGENVGPIAVKVQGSGGGHADGGSSGPEALDGGAPLDSSVVDIGTLDVGTLFDGQSPGGLDAQPGLDTGSKTDAPDAALDTPPPSDVPPTIDMDLPPTDAPADVDAASADTAPVEAGTILSTMSSCKKYVHYPDSPETCVSGSLQEDVLINSLAFTPDGKYLISAGNNTWVKLWKVVDTGLEDTKTVVVGEDYSVTAAISPAGDVLSVVNPGADVLLYDMNTVIQGAALELGRLEASKLAAKTYRYTSTSYFTTDGTQLIVMYPTQSSLSSEKTIIAVWDLATLTLLREFDFDYPTWPLTAARAPAAGPLWAVVSKPGSVPDDAGSHTESTVTLVDASGSSTARPTFTVVGEVYRAAFSADQRALAIGTSEGEVSLWDLTNLSNIVQYGSPLVAGGSSDTVYGLAYSGDGKFLASGSWMWNGASTLRVIDLQSRAVYKRSAEFEPRSFAFAADGTTWAYGLGGCGFLYFCQD